MFNGRWTWHKLTSSTNSICDIRPNYNEIINLPTNLLCLSGSSTRSSCKMHIWNHWNVALFPIFWVSLSKSSPCFLWNKITPFLLLINSTLKKYVSRPRCFLWNSCTWDLRDEIPTSSSPIRTMWSTYTTKSMMPFSHSVHCLLLESWRYK